MLTLKQIIVGYNNAVTVKRYPGVRRKNGYSECMLIVCYRVKDSKIIHKMLFNGFLDPVHRNASINGTE